METNKFNQQSKRHMVGGAVVTGLFITALFLMVAVVVVAGYVYVYVYVYQPNSTKSAPAEVTPTQSFDYKAAAKREIARQDSAFAAAKEEKVVAEALKFIEEANQVMAMLIKNDEDHGVSLSEAEKKLKTALLNKANASVIEALELEVEKEYEQFEAAGHSLPIYANTIYMQFEEQFEGKLSAKVYSELLNRFNMEYEFRWGQD